MVTCKLHRNAILTGTVDAFCLACDSYLKYEVEATAHIEKPVHKKNLDGLLYLEKYESDHIRKIKKGYYCEFCNMLLATMTRVRLHATESSHKDSRALKLLRRIGNAVIAFDSILIKECSWHGLIEDTCVICNIEFDNEDIHKNEREHILNLVQNKVQFDDDCNIFRKVDDSSFHCIICNTVLATDRSVAHFNSSDHKTHLTACRELYTERIQTIKNAEQARQASTAQSDLKKIEPATQKHTTPPIQDTINAEKEKNNALTQPTNSTNQPTSLTQSKIDIAQESNATENDIVPPEAETISLTHKVANVAENMSSSTKISEPVKDSSNLAVPVEITVLPSTTDASESTEAKLTSSSANIGYNNAIIIRDSFNNAIIIRAVNKNDSSGEMNVSSEYESLPRVTARVKNLNDSTKSEITAAIVAFHDNINNGVFTYDMTDIDNDKPNICDPDLDEPTPEPLKHVDNNTDKVALVGDNAGNSKPNEPEGSLTSINSNAKTGVVEAKIDNATKTATESTAPVTRRDSTTTKGSTGLAKPDDSKKPEVASSPPLTVFDNNAVAEKIASVTGNKTDNTIKTKVTEARASQKAEKSNKTKMNDAIAAAPKASDTNTTHKTGAKKSNLTKVTEALAAFPKVPNSNLITQKITSIVKDMADKSIKPKVPERSFSSLKAANTTTQKTTGVGENTVDNSAKQKMAERVPERIPVTVKATNISATNNTPDKVVDKQTETNSCSVGSQTQTNPVRTVKKIVGLTPLEQNAYYCKALGAKNYVIDEELGVRMCILCGWTLKSSWDAAQHVKDSHHTALLNMHKDRLAHMTRELCPSAPDTIEQKHEDVEDKSKILDALQEFQKNRIKVDLIAESAFCTICMADIEFEYDMIEGHIQEHKKKNIKKDQPVFDSEKKPKCDTSAAQNSDESKSVTRSSSTSSRTSKDDDVEELAALNKITINHFKNYAICHVCDTQISLSYESIKQHLAGIKHKGKLPKHSKSTKTVFLTKPLHDFINTIAQVQAVYLCDVIINDRICITRQSFLMFKDIVGKGFCLACQVFFRSVDAIKEHNSSVGHRRKQEYAEVVTNFENEFIRMTTPETYHCGHCNTVIDDKNDLERHLQTVEHNECKRANLWRLQMHLPEIKQERDAKTLVHVFNYLNNV